MGNLNITEESKRFKKFRKSIGLTQVEMAELLETQQTVISKYESGQLNIPIDAIKVLRLKYNMNYDWFFHGTGQMKTDKVERNTITTDIKNMMLDINITKAKLEQIHRDFVRLHADFYDKSKGE